VAINSTFELDVVEPNTVLIEQGKEPETLFIILEGNIDLYRKSEQQLALKQAALRRKCPHGLLLLSRNHTASETSGGTLIGIEHKAPVYAESGPPLTIVASKSQPQSTFGKLLILKVTSKIFLTKLKPNTTELAKILDNRLKELVKVADNHNQIDKGFEQIWSFENIRNRIQSE